MTDVLKSLLVFRTNKAMNKYLLIAILSIFVSCVKEEHSKSDDLTLLLSSYSLEKDIYKFFCCNSSDLKLIEIDSNTYYNYKDILFQTDIKEINGVRIREGELFEDLHEYLKILGAYGYTVDYIKEKILSIIIYSDVPFRGVSPGKSLNDFFFIQGDFIHRKDGKYKLYNGDDILGSKKVGEDIFFPRRFRLQLIEPPTDPSLYNFYMRLNLEDRIINVPIVEIHIKI